MTDLQNGLLQDSIIEKDYIVMDNQTYYINASIYDDCYNEGNFVGTFVMKRLEFEYAEDIDFKQKEFKFYKSFKINNEWKTIEYGTFIVQSIEQSDTEETVKITAYDYALKFAQPYETELDYASGTITLWQVFEEILGKLQITTDLTSFTNSDFIVDSNQFVEGYSYGNVMAQIAGISGNFAHIYEDKMCLIFTNETDVVIEKGQYSEFEDKRDAHPITIVVIEDGVVEGENISNRWEEGIELYGENYFKITGNLFAYTQAKRQQLITALFEKIKGFSYSAMKLTDCLFPQLKCGDKVKIRAKDGTLVDSLVLRWQNIDYSHTLEAPSIIKATVQYETPETALDIARRTEILVDKQNGTIQELVQTVEETFTTTATTEEGKEFHLTDAADNYCKRVEIFGESSQNGVPTPNTPVEIDSVSGNVEFRSIGKNLFNENAVTVGKYINADGIEASNYDYSLSEYIKVTANKVYFYQGITSYSERGAFYDKDKNLISTFVESTIPENQKITIPANAEYVRFSLINTNDNIDKFQLELGERTLYEPYNESITTIPLFHDMRSLPNGVRDRIFWQDNKWYDERRIGQIIFDGTQEFVHRYANTSTTRFTYTKILDKKLGRSNDNLLSNYFKCDPTVWNDSPTTVGISGAKNNTNIFIRMQGDISYENFYTWLSEHPTEVLYELAEPIVTEITEEETIDALEKIKTFTGITNITADALSILTYYRDTPMVNEYELKSDAIKKEKEITEKVTQQQLTADGIISSVSQLTSTITEDYVTKEEAYTQQAQTEEKFEFEISKAITDLKEEGISKVITTQVTIDENGLTVGKSDSEFTNTMNNTGTYQFNAGELIAKYDKDGAEIPRLKSDFAIIAGLKYTQENVGGIVHHKTYVLE